MTPLKNAYRGRQPAMRYNPACSPSASPLAAGNLLSSCAQARILAADPAR